MLKLAFAIFLVHSGPGYSNAEGDFIEHYCKQLGENFLKCLRDRPHWQPGVETLFKEAQQIENAKKAKDKINFHLCHVMSWNTIKDQFLKYSKNQKNRKGFLQRMSENDKKVNDDVKYFLDNLFDNDIEAVAPRIDGKGNWEYVSHSEIINYRNDKNYKYKSLSDISKKLKDQALQLTDKNVFDVTEKDTDFVIQNCDLIKSALDAMNSAPANLRYGDAIVNKEIRDKTDPMGNINGTATFRERKIIGKQCYKECAAVGQTCKSSTGRYFDINRNIEKRKVRKGKTLKCRSQN